jgi:predicted amidophosphoribosyltransferase
MRRERRTIEIMVDLYCQDWHGSPKGQLCPDCQALRDYAIQRLDHCPFQERKTTCVNCAVHCYKKEMRERVREVMRYAGPRMLMKSPILAVQHLLDGRQKEPKKT